MNVVISDTAEYGCYLFDQPARPLLKAFVGDLGADVIGTGMSGSTAVDNRRLIEVNADASLSRSRGRPASGLHDRNEGYLLNRLTLVNDFGARRVSERITMPLIGTQPVVRLAPTEF